MKAMLKTMISKTADVLFFIPALMIAVTIVSLAKAAKKENHNESIRKA